MNSFFSSVKGFCRLNFLQRSKDGANDLVYCKNSFDKPNPVVTVELHEGDCQRVIRTIHVLEMYQGLLHTSKMKPFATIVNGFQL